MKRINLICISALCVSSILSFVGCSEDKSTIGEGSLVTSLSFTDENPEAMKIGGKLTWTVSAPSAGASKYVIYGSSDGISKDTKIGEVAAGANSFDISYAEYSKYLLVASEDGGSNSTSAGLSVVDFVETGSISALYFLNSGNMGNNNATLTMCDLVSGTISQDYFKVRNGRGLGDTAQDMIVYGNKMYIAVYGESTIEVTNLNAKSVKQIKTDGQPRYMVADGGKVYISYFNGNVACLDTTTLTVEKTVKVGRNPEQLAIANHKLYVANSGGMDYNTPTGYDKTVSIIDLPSFSETKKLDMVLNPVNVQADGQGNVYVISKGNYKDVWNTFQRIDSETNEVSIVKDCSNATEMAYHDGLLYLFYSQWNDKGEQIPTFLTYNTKDKVVGGSFIKDGTIVKAPYYISIAGPNVYLTESNFTNNGDVYAFDSTGKLLKKYEAGLNPVKVVLAQNDSF